LSGDVKISVIFYLNEEEGLEQKIEEHVCNDLADAGKRLSFTSRHLKRQISNVLPSKTQLYISNITKQICMYKAYVVLKHQINT